MKKALAMAAGLAMFASSVPAFAEDVDMESAYKGLIHCAAVNQIASEVLGMDDGATKNKDAIETFNHYSIGLMFVAAVGTKRDAETVIKDTGADHDQTLKALSDDSNGADAFKKDLSDCVDLGKEAAKIMDEATKDK